jgi:hypothetical protein
MRARFIGYHGWQSSGGDGLDQTTRVRPSLWQCLWAVPFFLTGAVWFGYTLFHGLMHVTDLLTQVVVPGSAELNLQPGQYSVFLEEQSTVNGKIYSTTESVSGLSCRMRSVQTGAPIAMQRSSANVTYDVNGRSGHSVLEFFVKQAGKYEFACDYGGASKGPEVVVAVGSGVGSAITRTVLGGLSAFFGGAGAGVVVILLVVFRRERAKMRVRVDQTRATADPSVR